MDPPKGYHLKPWPWFMNSPAVIDGQHYLPIAKGWESWNLHCFMKSHDINSWGLENVRSGWGFVILMDTQARQLRIGCLINNFPMMVPRVGGTGESSLYVRTDPWHSRFNDEWFQFLNDLRIIRTFTDEAYLWLRKFNDPTKTRPLWSLLSLLYQCSNSPIPPFHSRFQKGSAPTSPLLKLPKAQFSSTVDRML
jgi:hypothetical protein